MDFVNNDCPQMTKLSVVIITFNEEKNIERCILSVLDIADEIVVVDSFSTDRTKEICLKYNVKFVENPFAGHIEQKNFVITQAFFKHILSLDADEALDDTLKESIRKVKENWDSDGYYMNRLTNYCGKWIRHCGWYPDHKLRLFDSTKGKWGGVNPHDKFIMGKKAKISYLKGNILHYSYYTIEEHYNQIEKFTDISSQALFNEGKKSSRIKIYGSSVFKFIRNYILKMGFLDGKAGFTISRLSAMASYKKYYKLRMLNRNG